MNTFMAILSQLFWGVTIGALSATFTAIGEGVILVLGLGGLAWYTMKRRRGGPGKD